MAGHPGHTSEREIEIGQEISLVIPDQGRPNRDAEEQSRGWRSDGRVRSPSTSPSCSLSASPSLLVSRRDVWEDDVPPTSGPLSSGRTGQDGAGCRS